MTAEEFFYKGLESYEAGRLEKAITDFTQAIALDPNNASTYDNRGLVYDKLKQYPEAIADYTVPWPVSSQAIST
jgi:tetratricopeptide (TPR) repeat protein